MVGQLIQNLVWIFPNGSTVNTKPCLDTCTSKWWINGPSKTIWMDLNGSTACYQHCSNGITMYVQNQWAFLKVEILNGFKWSISRRVNDAACSPAFRINFIWNRENHGRWSTDNHQETQAVCVWTNGGEGSDRHLEELDQNTARAVTRSRLWEGEEAKL